MSAAPPGANGTMIPMLRLGNDAASSAWAFGPLRKAIANAAIAAKEARVAVIQFDTAAVFFILRSAQSLHGVGAGLRGRFVLFGDAGDGDAADALPFIEQRYAAAHQQSVRKF